MDEYSNQEITDIHLMYGLAECNPAVARYLCANRFPNRHLSDKKIFQELHERLRDTGSFKKRISNNGKSVSIRTVNLEEQILNHSEENDGNDNRRLIIIQDVGHITTWKILRDQQFYSYYVQRVQAFKEDDFPLRFSFKLRVHLT